MTESSPKVSIVLPTYNGERYLQRAIESCLEQTHQNIELVVVDDCSTDSTPEIIQSFTTTSTSRPCSIWTSAATPAVASNNDPAGDRYATWPPPGRAVPERQRLGRA